VGKKRGGEFACSRFPISIFSAAEFRTSENGALLLF